MARINPFDIPENYLTVLQFSKKVGRNKLTIYKNIEKGHIESTKLDNNLVVIHKDELKKFENIGA